MSLSFYIITLTLYVLMSVKVQSANVSLLIIYTGCLKSFNYQNGNKYKYVYHLILMVWKQKLQGALRYFSFYWADDGKESGQNHNRISDTICS